MENKRRRTPKKLILKVILKGILTINKMNLEVLNRNVILDVNDEYR